MMTETRCPRCGVAAAFSGALGRCGACGEMLGPRPEERQEEPAAVVVRAGPTAERGSGQPRQDPRQAPGTPAWVVWLAAALALVTFAGVIVIVVAVLIPRYRAVQDPAKEAKVQADIQNIQKAMDAFRVRNGDWPNDLTQLTMPDPRGGPPLLRGVELNDPWGIPYQYDRFQMDPATGRPMIRSVGQEMDGQGGPGRFGGPRQMKAW
jgi:hypothetical protein